MRFEYASLDTRNRVHPSQVVYLPFQYATIRKLIREELVRIQVANTSVVKVQNIEIMNIILTLL